MKLSVRKKLLLAFTTTILTSILITCVVLGLQIRDSAIATFHFSASKELGQIDRAIGIFVNKALKMTTLIATSPLGRAADESVHSCPLSPKDIARSDVERDMVAFFKLVNIANVATAIKEQSVATRDIAGNVAQTSQGLQEINVNVAESSTVIKDVDRATFSFATTQNAPLLAGRFALKWHGQS